MTRPRFSTLFVAALALLGVLLLVAAILMGRSSAPEGKTVLTVRLWDPQVAAAYRQSFEAFGAAHPDIEVHVDVVSYASYFDTLRTDVAGGSAADVFWLSNSYFAEYADSGRLLPIEPSPAWEPAVVEQFTRNQTLWGVPQLTDAGIAVYYNADLLAAAGLSPQDLADLRWGGPADTLRSTAARLTLDTSGRRADQPGFDPGRIRQWGYNAANDFQGIYLNFLASAGGQFHDGQRFDFASPAGEFAFGYLVDLINRDHVAPSAADTNDNGDFSRNQFLAGRMALFQSGTYNLANVAESAQFDWGVAMLPTGPAGRVSVTNGIVAAGNAASAHPEAVRRLLGWLGSTAGNRYVAESGAAIPAVLDAQPAYLDYWAGRGVDVGPFFDALDGPHVSAPGGTGFAAGYQAIKPYFAEMFLGRLPVPDALRHAQQAANEAAAR